MRLIAGLGNPGPQYDQTRHNVGFEVVDRLARRFGDDAVARARFHGAVVDASLDGARAVLLKPATMMNRSGQSVAEAVRFYKLDPATDLLVIVDDVALACGMIRLRASGGAGGHNGLSDVERLLATDEYARLRVGIDRPGEIPQEAYVLGRFRPDQRDLVESALDEAVEAAVCWASSGILEAMNRFNRRQTANTHNDEGMFRD